MLGCWFSWTDALLAADKFACVCSVYTMCLCVLKQVSNRKVKWRINFGHGTKCSHLFFNLFHFLPFYWREFKCFFFCCRRRANIWRNSSWKYNMRRQFLFLAICRSSVFGLCIWYTMCWPLYRHPKNSHPVVSRVVCVIVNWIQMHWFALNLNRI